MIKNRGESTGGGRLPLAGVRVLDLTDEAVVLAPRLLADLGATVARVEAGTGDALRRRPPFLDGEPGVERSLAHVLYNGGKLSVALDLDQPQAWDVIDRLAHACAVVIAPLTKSVYARTFLDEGRFATAHPETGLVDAVFRRDMPEAAVTDLIGVAAGGLLYLNGFKEDPPNVPAGLLAYKQTALSAALAAMTLVMRRRQGRAGRITVAMQEAVMLTTIQTANENYWHWQRTIPGRNGLGALGGRSLYQSADGRWLSFTVPPPYWDAFTAWLAEVTGDTELQSTAWRDRQYQLDHRDTIAEHTARLCAALNRDVLVSDGQRRRLLVLPVNDVAAIAADPHLAARGFFAPVYYPQFERDLTIPSPAFLSSAYVARPQPAPRLGEHTHRILHEWAGLSTEEIAALATAGVAVEATTPAGRRDGC